MVGDVLGDLMAHGGGARACRNADAAEVGVGRRAVADMDVEMGRGTRLLLLAASARLTTLRNSDQGACVVELERAQGWESEKWWETAALQWKG
jgi:hypothetical protein